MSLPQSKKSKKLKSKVDSNGNPLSVSVSVSVSGESKPHFKKKKDKTGTKSLSLKSGSEGQLTALKVKGERWGNVQKFLFWKPEGLVTMSLTICFHPSGCQHNYVIIILPIELYLHQSILLLM